MKEEQLKNLRAQIGDLDEQIHHLIEELEMQLPFVGTSYVTSDKGVIRIEPEKELGYLELKVKVLKHVCAKLSDLLQDLYLDKFE